MTSDLARYIASACVVDTHEHLNTEKQWVESGPKDVLADLFHDYFMADLLTAGATEEACQAVLTDAGQDLERRWAGVKKAWESARFTGYGEAVRTLARHVYGIDEITPESMIAAQPKLDAMRNSGERLRILCDLANIDHVQIDDFQIACHPDPSGPEFFFFDLSWVKFVNGLRNGAADVEQINKDTGVEIKDIASLRQAMEAAFAAYGRCAIAVKSQHAYARTLRWEHRTDADAGRALQALLANGSSGNESDRLCLGDWCLARGVELSIEYNLPFKIHCGHYAGNSYMISDRLRAGHLCPLLVAYPNAKFVLMHIAYPYENELISIAKHFPNVWVDLCWAWSINPRASADFVRRFLHAAPINKLFAFGGDTRWPTSSYAYCLQMRKWLARALAAEVAEGDLCEAEAIGVASRVLHDNQLECFDLAGVRASIRQVMKESACQTK